MVDKDLKKISQLALASHGLKAAPEISSSAVFWDASFFQVAESSLYRSLRSEQQQDFLARMSSHILHEACSIETAGLTYSARMNLLSKSVDEKIIYALIGAEEALHLKSLEPFYQPLENTERPYFAGLIHQWIEKLERPSLLVMIQILLEGWGLTYYQSLAQNSLDPRLQAVLAQILQDESRHHATGVVLYRHESLPAQEREKLEQELITLFQCVQVGPQQAAVELAVASGEKSVDFAQLLYEMNAVNDSQSKIDKLKRLLEKTADERLISACLQKDLFKVYSLEQMAMVAETQLTQKLKNSAPILNSQSELSL